MYKYALALLAALAVINPCNATTLIFDGTILATDSQGTLMSSDGHAVSKRLNAQKLHICKKRNTVIAQAGNEKDIHKFLDWYLNDAKIDPDWKGDFAIMEINMTTRVVKFYHGNLDPETSDAPVETLGSGDDVAMAALLAGKNAIQAIAIVEQIDMYTGGLIHYIDLSEKNPQLRSTTSDNAMCPKIPNPPTGMYTMTPDGNMMVRKPSAKK